MIKKKSHFKNEEEARKWFVNWKQKLEALNDYSYKEMQINTSLGKTQIYGLNWESDLPPLLIFPGFRTTTLIWDLDGGLQEVAKKFKVYLIETNGQPNLSDGNSPSIKTLDYGKWGEEVMNELKIEKASVAGASFGGLVCMKICITIPDRIEQAFLFNPGCFRLVSFGWKNMYSNLLPMFKPTEKNIRKFLSNVIFSEPDHDLQPESKKLLIDYLQYVLKNYKDRTEKPYYMGKQLDQVQTNVHLFLGTDDILIPYEKSLKRAKMHLGTNLKSVEILKAGHGIETYRKALNKIGKNKLVNKNVDKK
ncbi:MAG: alpha/beta hydrolase [Crocinitomicaceae bacterium]